MRQSLIDHLRKKRPLRNTGWGGYHPTALDPKEAERVVDALVEWLRDLNEGTVLYTDLTGRYAPVDITAGRDFAAWFHRLADLLSEET